MTAESLPTGTVTLLFTDIEGSTRLLHELGDGYADALAEHRRLLREAFASQGGIEVDTQGDAFFYAFSRASDALAAAEAGQRALDGGPVRVRMGVHTGEPTVTEEGYVGGDVHVAARVMGAGHGGQVLVSEATARLVDNELRDLGEHRLKDIERPVRLFQLGEGRFPPLKTLSNSNLPLPATPLLGRKKELADVLRLLRVERARLVTVTGPGGIGKTRFALEAAHELVEELAHGVWFIDLAALRDPALVTPTVAATLGSGGELADHVADKRLLLVLDNFEQVVEAARDVAELLRRCPNVQLLVTSREPLHVAGEREYPLRPLAESPAVELFRQRAEAADPGFDASWKTLSAIVARLDRLPLAVELAAARVKIFSADDLLAGLEQRLPLLTSRARDLPERQRALRATIEWSYELLSAEEQQLFRRLSVFAGGCTLEAAQEVCDADLDLLQSLVEKSLMRFDDERYWMLETIRYYAADALAGSDDADELRGRQAIFQLELAERLEPNLAAEPEQGLRLSSDEIANVRSALSWFAERGDDERRLRLAGALWRYWLFAGNVGEAERWLRRPTMPVTDAARASWLRALSWVYSALGRPDEAATAAEERLRHARTRGDMRGIGGSLQLMSYLAEMRGDIELAVQLMEDCVRHARADADPLSLGAAVLNLGQLLRKRGDYGRARALIDEALSLAEAEHVPLNRAAALHALATVAHHEGAADAPSILRRSLAEAWRVHWESLVPWQLHAAAVIAARRGNVSTAASLLRAGDLVRERLGSSPDIDDVELRQTLVAELEGKLTSEQRARAEERAVTMPLPAVVAEALQVLAPRHEGTARPEPPASVDSS